MFIFWLTQNNYLSRFETTHFPECVDEVDVTDITTAVNMIPEAHRRSVFIPILVASGHH